MFNVGEDSDSKPHRKAVFKAEDFGASFLSHMDPTAYLSRSVSFSVTKITIAIDMPI